MATHGCYRTVEYRAWKCMKGRCYNARADRYKHYGARGITVCTRWRNSFENFLADMGKRPSIEHSLGRKDNDGNYEPGNCRWETRIEQARNTTRNRYLEIGGAIKTLYEWCRLANLCEATVRYRLNHGWPMANLLAPPTSKHGRKQVFSRDAAGRFSS